MFNGIQCGDDVQLTDEHLERAMRFICLLLSLLFSLMDPRVLDTFLFVGITDFFRTSVCQFAWMVLVSPLFPSSHLFIVWWPSTTITLPILQVRGAPHPPSRLTSLDLMTPIKGQGTIPTNRFILFPNFKSNNFVTVKDSILSSIAMP
jgi:hypothetical protein